MARAQFGVKCRPWRPNAISSFLQIVVYKNYFFEVFWRFDFNLTEVNNFTMKSRQLVNYLANEIDLTDTGENVQKWTRVFSTRLWVILVARTRRKKQKKIVCPLLDVFAYGQVSSPRLYRLNENFSWESRKFLQRFKISKYWALSAFIFTFTISTKTQHLEIEFNSENFVRTAISNNR